jgi:LPXTG-motif cell wall-anchored protein
MRVLPLTLTALCVAAAPGTALAADHDPRGNNGTVKIDGEAFDGSHGNEPHVGCTFHLDFFGFDAAQTATITFTGQAPTKTGTLLTQKGVSISDDAAGGGQDTDAVLSYTADQLGLTGQPQAKQGWHVKVAVDVDDAPGGAKQKVFWLSCPSTAPERSTTTPTTTSTPATTSTSSTTPTYGGGATTSDTTAPTTSSTTTSTSTTTAPTGGSGSTEAAPLAPTYGSATLSGGGGGLVRGQAASPARLPFTGDQTGTLLLIGAGAVAAGTALTVVARRRRSTS